MLQHRQAYQATFDTKTRLLERVHGGALAVTVVFCQRGRLLGTALPVWRVYRFDTYRNNVITTAMTTVVVVINTLQHYTDTTWPFSAGAYAACNFIICIAVHTASTWRHAASRETC